MTLSFRHRLLLAQPESLYAVEPGETVATVYRFIGSTQLRPAVLATTDEADLTQMFYRNDAGDIETLSSLLAKDSLTVDPAVLFRFVITAYADQFTFVNLYYVDDKESLDHDTKIQNSILQGENLFETKEGEELWFNIADYQNNTARELTDELRDLVLTDFHNFGFDESNGWDIDDDIIEYFRDMETRDPIEDFVKNTDNPFVRALLLPRGEDTYETQLPEFTGTTEDETTVWATDILTAHGIEATRNNLDLFLDAYNETYYRGDWITLNLFGTVVLKDFYDATYDDDLVTIANPWLWVGNCHEGKGCLTEKPLDGSITIPRVWLHHDDTGPGYGIDNTCGFVKSYFPALNVTFSSSEKDN